MQTPTLTTRRLVAAAILAALPLATGVLRADAVRPTDASAPRSVAEHTPEPQWSYAVGEGLDVAQLLMCPSAWRCMLYTL